MQEGRPDTDDQPLGEQQNAQQEREGREQPDYSYVQSTITKKDDKNEVEKKIVQVINIIRSNKRKPFLGGYRNQETQVIYHNAFSQTDQIRTEHKLHFTRETQTYEHSSRSSKVPREYGTQMEVAGLFIDTRNDRVVEPKFYFDSKMWEERRNEAALFIQRLTRGMFARNRTNELKRQKMEAARTKMEQEEKIRKAEEIKHKKQIQRRKNPRTKEDFNILYEQLEVWRISQIQKINSDKTMTQAERKRALKETLDKETNLLQTIDRLKIIANKENKEQKIEKFLKSMSDPKKWVRNSDGRITQVHTPFTVRAKQLMDLYKGLRMRKVSVDERLDILLNTKWTVKEWKCNLTGEIVELIDRQANMLDRSRPESSLQGLRQRLANLFLQFIEYPLFNPEAARFQRIPYQIAEISEDAR